MRWEQDLIKDIRLHDDHLDNRDFIKRKAVPNSIDVSRLPPAFPSDFKLRDSVFSSCNQQALKHQFLKVKDWCEFILEIGVDRDGYATSSTRVFLDNKRKETIYLGVDIRPKHELNDPDNNVHTLCCGSENHHIVFNKIKELGAGKLGFFMIDGLHSINQVLTEWEYTLILDDNGIVAFHDTRYHPGPNLFVKNLDTTKWHVIHDACDNMKANEDYGIGFAWKK